MKDNAVGSSNTHFWEEYPEDLYIFGLWCADGYFWSSSASVTNVDERIIAEFAVFLRKVFGFERIRLRIYHPLGQSVDTKLWEKFSSHIRSYPMKKCRQYSFQLYVNSRPFLRLLQRSRKNVGEMTKKEGTVAYFAGRFDGDGSVYADRKSYCRIVYGSGEEVRIDQKLLRNIGITETSVYHYKKAREYCLYIKRSQARMFLEQISKYSRTQKCVFEPSRDCTQSMSDGTLTSSAMEVSPRLP
jgi:hypothetical protein